MARLYGEINTDRTDKHFIANERFLITLFYGSRKDSKEFAKVRISWEKGTDKPKIEIFEAIEWHEDTEDSWDEEREVKVYRTFYKGVHIMVYPCSIADEGLEGWEYSLYSEERNIDWDSWQETYTGRHGDSAEQVEQWAIRTVDEWKE